MSPIVTVTTVWTTGETGDIYARELPVVYMLVSDSQSWYELPERINTFLVGNEWMNEWMNEMFILLSHTTFINENSNG